MKVETLPDYVQVGLRLGLYLKKLLFCSPARYVKSLMKT